MIIDFLKKLYSLRIYFYSHEKYARRSGVKIGKNCWINTRNFSSEPYLITIGNDVQITANVTFLTHGGMWVKQIIDRNADTFGKIVIKDKTYIGTCSIIMPGVTIGEHVIVAAGSVVTKSLPDGVIVGGNPARIIGSTEEYIRKMEAFNVGTGKMNFKSKKKFLLSIDEESFIVKPLLKNTEK